MNEPVKPLKSVSSHTIETETGTIRTTVKRIVEVILVVDLNGDLWRRNGSQDWERLL